MDDHIPRELLRARRQVTASETEARRAAERAALTASDDDLSRALEAHRRLAMYRIEAKACEIRLRRAVPADGESDPMRYTI